MTQLSSRFFFILQENCQLICSIHIRKNLVYPVCRCFFEKYRRIKMSFLGNKDLVYNISYELKQIFVLETKKLQNVNTGISPDHIYTYIATLNFVANNKHFVAAKKVHSSGSNDLFLCVFDAFNYTIYQKMIILPCSFKHL